VVNSRLGGNIGFQRWTEIGQSFMEWIFELDLGRGIGSGEDNRYFKQH
jgi:hypothetical protein